MPTAPKPDDEKPDPLAPAVQALERGDLVEARRLARALLDGSDDPAVKERARAVLDQLGIDPVIVGVMVATLAVMLAIALRYLGAH